MSLRTSYEFALPRGYVDDRGAVHRTGTMRLATARDELEPLRDPTISGPDDPRLTIVVLARVVERLGTLELVTPHEIEGLFAADLAYLQDFYGVINFGTQAEFEEFVAAQERQGLPVGAATATSASSVDPSHAPSQAAEDDPAAEGPPVSPSTSAPSGEDWARVSGSLGRSRRSAIEEIPAETR